MKYGRKFKLRTKTYQVIENNIIYNVVDDSLIRYFYKNRLHRELEPAVIMKNSLYKAYYKHGKCHREDGPARINCDGSYEYWLDGNKYNSLEELIVASIIE